MPGKETGGGNMKTITITKISWDWEHNGIRIREWDNDRLVSVRTVPFSLMVDKFLRDEYRAHGVTVRMIGEE